MKCVDGRHRVQVATSENEESNGEGPSANRASTPPDSPTEVETRLVGKKQKAEEDVALVSADP